MSVESARAFIEKMKNDEEFRNRVTAAEDAEARLALVKSDGFDFTADEMESAKGTELTDEELDGIAVGGVVGCDFQCSCWDQCG